MTSQTVEVGLVGNGTFQKIEISRGILGIQGKHLLKASHEADKASLKKTDCFGRSIRFSYVKEYIDCF